ncbi:MAG: hypothetical protein MMC33_004885 [Icmadophila ericetorum]|nr:hypothetical protein [Icmadophila ericetorum]
MKTFILAVLLALSAATAHAAPPAPAQLNPRQGYNVTAIFTGAAGGFYTVQFLVDSGIFQATTITNHMSVSSIFVGPAQCSFEGIDGSFTFVLPGMSADVGPPQAIISGSCDIP